MIAGGVEKSNRMFVSPAHYQGIHHSRHHHTCQRTTGGVTTVQNALHGLPVKRKRKLCEKLCSTEFPGKIPEKVTDTSIPNIQTHALLYTCEARRYLCALSPPHHWLACSGTASAMATLCCCCCCCCYSALRLWLPLVYTRRQLFPALLDPSAPPSMPSGPVLPGTTLVLPRPVVLSCLAPHSGPPCVLALRWSCDLPLITKSILPYNN